MLRWHRFRRCWSCRTRRRRRPEPPRPRRWPPSGCWLRAWMSCLSRSKGLRSGRRSDAGAVVVCSGTPGEQPTLELADQLFGGQPDHGDDEHRREHTVLVEVVLSCRDDEAEALLGTEELPD